MTRLDAPRCRGGENPMWDPSSQQLHYVDNIGRKVHTLDTVSGNTRTLEMPSIVSTLVLRERGGVVVTLESGIHGLDLASGELEMIAPLSKPPRYGYNDGKVDRRGRFLIGGSTRTRPPEPKPDGGLYRLDPDHSLTQLDSGIHFSNSPCWSPDGGTFYFSDSWLFTTYAYDYDLETGAVANRRTFIETSELGGRPDGATVDADGLVWAAIYGGAKIAAFRPNGMLERVIDMPVRLVSSVMFGGPDLDHLYVTTIAHGIEGDAVEKGAGDLYAIEGLGVRGLSEHRFAG